MTNQHPKTDRPTDKDLQDNPGIGTSKGLVKGGDALDLDGHTTFEGDVKNDSTPQGGINPNQTGRANK